MTREELIAALEKAERPDYDLDLAIAEWCFRNGHVAGVDYDPSLWLLRTSCEFSVSLDAALTLVPEGYWWAAGDCKRESHASVGLEGGSNDTIHDTSGATPPNVAIALCIAALKARAA